jgi:phenylacetate-CoA ligase
MYSSVFRTLVFPALELYKGTTIQQHLAVLNKSQWWSKEQIEELQNKKLRVLIRHAYDNVPYYRRIFSQLRITPEDIKTKEDLNKIPVLKKEDIRKNLPDLLARNVPWSDTIETHSSGSTGEPVKYYIDKRSYSAGWAQTFRCWSWAGFQLGDPYVKISLNPRTSTIKKIQDRLLQSKYIYGAGITDSNIAQEIDEIRQFKPKIIRNYGSHMFAMAKLMEKNNIFYEGAAIATTGSTLYPHYRAVIEKQFNGKVFDAYGGESTAVSFECEEHDGHHICDEDVVVEFLKETEHVVPGEMGRVVFTNLNNFAMPVIRYDIRDIARHTGEVCPCGRGLSLMKSIEGRDSDIISTPGGDFIVVEFFVILFEYMTGVDQFQVTQDTLDHITIKIIKNQHFTDDELQHIRNEVQKRAGDEVRIAIEFVDEIPLSGRSGKRRLVVSHVPLKI